MSHRSISKLNPRKAYLQIALNNTLEEAYAIISKLPRSDRILLEVGTPLIKRYGEQGIRQIRDWYGNHLRRGGLLSAFGIPTNFSLTSFQQSEQRLEQVNGEEVMQSFLQLFKKKTPEDALDPSFKEDIFPYVVADLKTMDRGETEVEIAFRGGASAAIALGSAPIETLNTFIASCEAKGLDAMIDMMNVEYPLAVLRKLKKIPPLVIFHP